MSIVDNSVIFSRRVCLAGHFLLWGWWSPSSSLGVWMMKNVFHNLFLLSVSLTWPLWALAGMHCIFLMNWNKRQRYSESILVTQNAIKSNDREGSEISALQKQTWLQANNLRVQSSLCRVIKNNGIKERLLVYPELPEYTANLTSLLGLC